VSRHVDTFSSDVRHIRGKCVRTRTVHVCLDTHELSVSIRHRCFQGTPSTGVLKKGRRSRCGEYWSTQKCPPTWSSTPESTQIILNRRTHHHLLHTSTTGVLRESRQSPLTSQTTFFGVPKSIPPSRRPHTTCTKEY
jgi:hypothetical protein